MNWLDSLLGGNQQSGNNQSKENPPMSYKAWERCEYDMGFAEGGKEDGSLSSPRNRGRATREEVEHEISRKQLKG